MYTVQEVMKNIEADHKQEEVTGVKKAETRNFNNYHIWSGRYS